MLRWALVFAVLSLSAGMFGFTGIVPGVAEPAKIFFVLFLSLCVIFLVMGFTLLEE